MPRSMGVFEVFKLIEEHLHRQDVVRARALIDQVLAHPKLPPALRTYVRIFEADCAIKQNQFDEARRGLRLAMEEAPRSERLKAMALVLLAGIDMRVGATPDTLQMLEDVRAIATRFDDNALHGDASFNLAVLQAERGELLRAEELFVEAKSDYVGSNRASRALDCDHMLATLRRVEKRDTDDDLEAMRGALAMAIRSQDHAQISRVGGDLARTHFCRYLEDGGAHNLEDAKAILLQVLVAQDMVWGNSVRAAHRIGARIELASDTFNNLETALLVETELGHPELALTFSSRAKARILREEVGERNLATIESFRARDPRLAALTSDGLAAQALPLALDDLARVDLKRVAVVDQFALSGDQLLITVDVTGGHEDSAAWSQIASWPGEGAPSLAASLGRGYNQGVRARETLARVLKGFEAFADRAASLYDDRVAPDDEQRAAILQMAEEHDEDLRRLGGWMFPTPLVERLRDLNVEHVIVCPDPRLFDVPFASLVGADGVALLDQPWTMSILPSALNVYDILRRVRIEAANEALHVFAPDQEVNEHLAGNEEVAAIVRRIPYAQVHWATDANRQTLRLAADNSRWIHIVSHGTGSASGYIPKLADGPWDESLGSSRSPFLVSTCCRTGETTARGQDVFGFVEMVDRDDFAGLLTPVISVDGFAAAVYMTHLYDRLGEGAGISVAAKAASKAIRAIIPHPAAWGVYACIGDPWRKLQGVTPCESASPAVRSASS